MKNCFKSLNMSFMAFLFFLLIPVSLFAQTNFSGSWSLNESKSNFGEGRFRFAASALVVTQDALVLTVESTMQGPEGGEVKATSKYNLDGSVSENPWMNTTRKSTVTWSADKTSLTIASSWISDRGGQSTERKSSETWKLAEGGKMLMLENVRTGRDGNEVKTTVAYDKK